MKEQLKGEGRRARALAALACAAMALPIALASCLSAPRIEEASSVGESDSAALDDAEIEIVAIRTAPDGVDKAKAAALGNSLAAMRRAKVLQADYLIRLYCLSGEAYLLSGDPVSAKAMLKSADDLSGYGSQAGKPDPSPLLRALLVPDAKKRLALMESEANPALWSSKPEGVPPRLQCELALLYLAEKRYSDALSNFDKALSRLPERLRGAYAPSREACARALEAGVSASNASIAEAKPLTLGRLARAIRSEAPELLPDRAEFDADEGAIIDALAERRLLPAQADRDPKRPAERADAVLALFALYVQRSGEKSLETRYTEKYAPPAGSAGANGRSPVPDLEYGSEIFDEALALVEREIMDLVDGKSFQPRKELDGMAFLEMLKRLPAKD